MKKLFIVFIILSLYACGNKKDEILPSQKSIIDLEEAEKHIEKALESLKNTKINMSKKITDLKDKEAQALLVLFASVARPLLSSYCLVVGIEEKNKRSADCEESVARCQEHVATAYQTKASLKNTQIKLEKLKITAEALQDCFALHERWIKRVGSKLSCDTSKTQFENLYSRLMNKLSDIDQQKLKECQEIIAEKDFEH